MGCTLGTDSPDVTTGLNLDVKAAAAALTFTHLSAGNNQSCGTATGGQAYCWGRGILGDGSEGFEAAPVAVAGGLTFVRISAGTTHSCGLTVEGRAYCWGRNEFGELGDGAAPTGQPTPVPVAGNRRFTQVQVGFRHSCALTVSGVAFCWGENATAQLGIGTTDGPENCSGLACSTRPTRVAGNAVFRQIRPGGEHTCALDAERRYFCWGSNIFGQLGDGTLTLRTRPVRVTGYLFAQVSAGGMHTCGVTPEHTAYCWGRNEIGQLGDGSVTRRLRPRKVSGSLRFAGVSAGVPSARVRSSRAGSASSIRSWILRRHWLRAASFGRIRQYCQPVAPRITSVARRNSSGT